MTSYFDIKLIDSEYKIIDTNLFEFVGIENVFGFVMKIIALILGIFLFVILVVVIVILYIVKKNKKNSNYINQQINSQNNFSDISLK